MLGGKSMPSNMAANRNHTTLLKIKVPRNIFPKCVSCQISCGKKIFMCSVNFWHQQYSNSLFKGSTGHVTSQCKWPIQIIAIMNFKSWINSVNLIRITKCPFLLVMESRKPSPIILRTNEILVTNIKVIREPVYAKLLHLKCLCIPGGKQH